MPGEGGASTSSVRYLGSPTAVDERADGLVGPCAAGIQVCPVPRLDQTDEVCTLALAWGMRGGKKTTLFSQATQYIFVMQPMIHSLRGTARCNSHDCKCGGLPISLRGKNRQNSPGLLFLSSCTPPFSGQWQASESEGNKQTFTIYYYYFTFMCFAVYKHNYIIYDLTLFSQPKCKTF